MAAESPFVYDESYIASSDLSSKQFYIVSSSAANYADMCTASSGGISVTTRAVGVLQNAPTSGHVAQVRHLGKTKMVASSSGTIAVGAFVACTTWGTAMTGTTGCWMLGQAYSASTGVSGQLIEVMLLGPFSYQAAGATA